MDQLEIGPDAIREVGEGIVGNFKPRAVEFHRHNEVEGPPGVQCVCCSPGKGGVDFEESAKGREIWLLVVNRSRRPLSNCPTETRPSHALPSII